MLDRSKDASDRLETATPWQIIEWAVANTYPKLTMATAFGPEGCVILYLLSKIEPRVHVFNLDTGYQFKETLELRDEIARRYGIEVELKRADTHGRGVRGRARRPAVQDQPRPVLLRPQGARCSREAAKGWPAWMSGIRRDQSPDRAKAPIVGWDESSAW